MSHGNDHKDYIKIFGDPGPKSRGLTVLCDGMAPKSGQEVQQVDRTLCLVRARGEACNTCEHGQFTVRFQTGIGHQIVACPRWETLEDELARKLPIYAMVRREICITRRPFTHCAGCPNQNPIHEAQTKEGWYEEVHPEYGRKK